MVGEQYQTVLDGASSYQICCID